MKIRFQVNVNRDERQIVVSIVCNCCSQEALSRVVSGVATLSCPTHGKLGSVALAELSAMLDRVENDAAIKEGWGSRESSEKVAHRADEKPS